MSSTRTGYCSIDDVKRYVYTSMTDANITNMIWGANKFIDNEIGPQDANDQEIIELAAMITAKRIKMRDPLATWANPMVQVRQNPMEYLDAEIERIFAHYSNKVTIV